MNTRTVTYPHSNQNISLEISANLWEKHDQRIVYFNIGKKQIGSYDLNAKAWKDVILPGMQNDSIRARRTAIETAFADMLELVIEEATVEETASAALSETETRYFKVIAENGFILTDVEYVQSLIDLGIVEMGRSWYAASNDDGSVFSDPDRARLTTAGAALAQQYGFALYAEVAS